MFDVCVCEQHSEGCQRAAVLHVVLEEMSGGERRGEELVERQETGEEESTVGGGPKQIRQFLRLISGS